MFLSGRDIEILVPDTVVVGELVVEVTMVQEAVAIWLC
jgi:hypothetical protein